ncbi:MAG: integrase core domain-containing protein [Candidatus Kapaibacterium sp.]|nr:MAG: integrase core domain-containing protein [Candidatus Kapabacteria bacterium]
MDEQKLLLGKVIRSRGKRTWVQYRQISAHQPMEYLCLDIKYVWVHGEGRWYYLLSIMDVFSRKIIQWIFQRSVRKHDVIVMFRRLHTQYNLKGVLIRNDNGSQFLANQVRSYLAELEAKQEFTHVATPEENAYIEAFHSILQRELVERFEFSSFYEANQHLQHYMQWYNYERKHRKLGPITPQQKWETGLLTTSTPEFAHVSERARLGSKEFTEHQTQFQLSGITDPTTDAVTRRCSNKKENNRHVLHIFDNNSV